MQNNKETAAMMTERNESFHLKRGLGLGSLKRDWRGLSFEIRYGLGGAAPKAQASNQSYTLSQ